MLDVRGLEQPEPLLRALAALGELAAGEYLHLLSHRDPVLLYPLLAQQWRVPAPAERSRSRAVVPVAGTAGLCL